MVEFNHKKELQLTIELNNDEIVSLLDDLKYFKSIVNIKDKTDELSRITETIIYELEKITSD